MFNDLQWSPLKKVSAILPTPNSYSEKLCPDKTCLIAIRNPERCPHCPERRWINPGNRRHPSYILNDALMSKGTPSAEDVWNSDEQIGHDLAKRQIH